MATIHPYKGYLNTEFQLLSQSEKEVSYFITHKDSGSTEKAGLLRPNIPQKIMLSNVGNYDVVFGDGSKTEIFVEDGYKFGGGSHKAFFIFDDCPWVFVVMRDRTYFHNRDTGEEYVEYMSPDSITVVSRDFVLMQNNGQDEVTLYSLTEQKPIICVSNIIFHNHSFLAWCFKDSDNEKQELVIFSLSQKEEIARSVCDCISIDKSNMQIHFANNNHIHSIDVSSESGIEEKSFSPNGKFAAFAQIKYVVFIESKYAHKEIVVYEIANQVEQNRIITYGNIARINDNKLINIYQRKQSIQDFDLSNSDFPEAIISASYTEYDIYPCKTDTFYKEQITEISSNVRSATTNSTLKSVVSELNESLGNCNNVVITDRIFCIYGSQESILIRFNEPKRVFHAQNGGSIYSHGDRMIYERDGKYAFLNKNYGFWGSLIEGDFNFSYFNDYGIIIDNNTKEVKKHNQSLGKFITYNKLFDYVKTEKGRISRDGYILWVDKDEFVPTHFSPKFTYGIELKDDKILLYTNKNNKFSEPKIILEDLFDTSKYSNAFLSENGHQIIHRNNDVYRMIDLGTGDTTEFDNLSFVEHINGVRPQFRITDSSQAILINPMNGLPVDTFLLDEYQFVSPDGKFYADKALDKYIEYYDHIQQRLISKEEYLEFYDKFNLLVFDKEKRKEKVQNRKNFVQKHSDFLIVVLRKKGYQERSTEEFQEILIDEKNIYGISWFLELFIETRGIAVVCRTEDKSEVARINLGKPLWFLNYVSFSYDNRYVAIAGRYPNNSGYSGLFLVYDLKNKEIITDNKSSYAVWTTTFTKEGNIAAYTSCPNSIVCDIKELPQIEKKMEKSGEIGFPVCDVNFLSFSPDGRLFACSFQGYIPYRRKDGNINANWGHQQSSLVSIRKADSPDDEIIRFSDLSDEGVAGTNQKCSVASVSFSNDNSRIMMVGRDGCMIIRNLHL